MKDLDDYIKKHLDNINPPFDESAEKAWERLLPRLPQQEKKPFALPVFFPKNTIVKNLFMAVSIGTLAVGSAFLFLKNNENQNPNQIQAQNHHVVKNKNQENNIFENQNKNQSQIKAKNEVLQRENNPKTTQQLQENQYAHSQILTENTPEKQKHSLSQKENVAPENATPKNMTLENVKNKSNAKIVFLKNKETKKTPKKHKKNNLSFKNSALNNPALDNILAIQVLPKQDAETKSEKNLYPEKNTFGHTDLDKNGLDKNLMDKNIFIPLKTILSTENLDKNPFYNATEDKNAEIIDNEKELDKKAEIGVGLTKRLKIEHDILANKNKIQFKRGFYVTQSQMIAPLVEGDNRTFGIGLANEVIFNDKYSIFTTLGVAQQRYEYLSSEADNFILMRGGNGGLSGFKTHIHQNMVQMNVEGRVYPDFMQGKGFFGLGLPLQFILHENRRDEGLEYWFLAQKNNQSKAFNPFTHLNLSMGASVPLNSKTELQISPVFQIPLYKIYKDEISGYVFGVKGIVLLR